MNEGRNLTHFILRFLPLAIIGSILLTSLLAQSVRNQVERHFKGFLFELDNAEGIDASLYYTFSDRFADSLHIINASGNSDSLWFPVPRRNEMIKNFRLDLGNTPRKNALRIKSLQLVFDDKRIVLDEKKVFESFFLHSASLSLREPTRDLVFRNDTKPFDPYIIFSPLGQLALPKGMYLAALIIPFAILVIICLLRFRFAERITLPVVLVGLFILSIPLKIAWTTFCTLLLCLYGLITVIRRPKMASLNSASTALIAIFTIYLLFGRPDSLAVIEKEFALLLFAFLGITVPLPRVFASFFYVLTFLFLNSVLLSAGISFLWRFDSFFALDVFQYFREIKIYSGEVRNWLYYDHAAFLSFFGLVGVLFLKELKRKGIIGNRFVYAYHGVLLPVLFLMGSRICLVIYGVYLINFLVGTHSKRSWWANAILWGAIAAGLISNIQRIDTNRYQLWTVTWQAIRESPWLGYGLGESEKVLTNADWIRKAGVSAPEGLNHSHNQIFTSLLEIGVLGTVFILLILFAYCKRTRQYRNEALGLFLVGMAYIFLTESVLQTSKPLYVICFLFLLVSRDRDNIAKKGIAL